MKISFSADEIGRFTTPSRARQYQQMLDVRATVEHIAEAIERRGNQPALQDGTGRDWHNDIGHVTATDL